MNIDPHPFLVHFPIALLFVYGALELLRWKKIFDLPYWFYVKGFILFFGVAGGAVALQSGDFLEHVYDGTPLGPLVLLHSLWGTAAIYIFAALAAAYIVKWMNISGWHNRLFSYPVIGGVLRYAWPFLCGLSARMLDFPWIILAVLAGLTALSFAGALGGAIVYGPDVDPFVYFIYHLFF
ncbi:MAG: hypothetical protein AAB378_01250 [Patescibacteria group bacterium]